MQVHFCCMLKLLPLWGLTIRKPANYSIGSAIAHASEINTSGSELMDAIFWERCRELIGEGHYYYDLVRTGKVYNRNYCMNPMTRTNFNVGAWTWPIHRNALKNNTQIGLNLFWE